MQGDSYCVVKRLAGDFGNSGDDQVKVQVNPGREPAIVALQTEIGFLRKAKKMCVNSLVGGTGVQRKGRE